LERRLLGRRQRAARTTPDEPLRGLSRREPLAERLDARVFAQPRLELEPEGQSVLVELLVLRLVGWHQELRLQIDQGRGHHEVRPRRFEVAEFHRLEVSEVLVGDRADRQGGQIDLARAAEVQEQIEGPLEASDPKRGGARGVGDVGFVGAHGARRSAARTPSIVAWATLRARREPSCRISTIAAGFSANFCRRSRIALRGGSMCLSSTSLQSRQPIPAVRHPVAHASRSAIGVKILCRSNTGQISGLPGSVRRLRAGSVTIGRTLAVIVSAVSARSIVLLYDFDIFRPSVPGTFGISVSFASGSGNSSPNALLNRRATSRVSSTWGT